jgi:hypothetical protein
MSTFLFILGTVFVSFLAILVVLIAEVIDIKNGHRPDFPFVIIMSTLSLMPLMNALILFIGCMVVVHKVMKYYGYSKKIEDYIVKIVRG